MPFVAFAATLTLGLASSYASYVWVVEAVQANRRHHPGTGAGYALLAVTNVATALVIGFALVGHPLTLPQGVATLLLGPIIAVPAFLVHRARRRTAAIIDEVRGG